MSVTVIRNALAFDGWSEDLLDGVDIVIEAGRIVEIATGRASLEGDLEIDARGQTVLPGLIDAHVHLLAVNLVASRNHDSPLTLIVAEALPRIRAMLDRGFTTVRDVAGADYGLREALARGLIVGPRAFICGPGFTQTGGHGDHRRRADSNRHPDRNANGLDFFSRIVDGPQEMRLAVRDELRKGADHIKLMASGGVGSPHDAIDDYQFTEEEIAVAAEEAAMRGKYVAAHTYGPTAVRRAVGNGVRTVEHCNLIDEETARFVAERDAFVVPTLVCYEKTLRDGSKLGLSPYVVEKLAFVTEAGVKMLEHCERAGVKMGFGTDLMGEMEEAQSHEFVIRAHVQKPIDILRSATSINAEILNKTGELGTIAVGAMADLVAVDGNPFKDISLLDGQGEGLSMILQGGRPHACRLPMKEASSRRAAAE
ncbi:MAG: amidohydrolase family protein [Devosia sp.]